MVLDVNKIQKVLDAIGEVVQCDGSWLEKKDAILDRADEDEKSMLDEFVEWFT